VGSGTPERRRVARGHSRGSRTGGPQQDHVRPVAGDRELRAVGRAVDRGERRKEGKGILPVADEPLGPPEVYGRDRLFVALTLAGDEGENDATEPRLHALMAAGHPVVRLALEDRYDLGQAFFRWEFAAAVAGAIMGINAFDQPNVAESKQNTKDVLA